MKMRVLGLAVLPVLVACGSDPPPPAQPPVQKAAPTVTAPPAPPPLPSDDSFAWLEDVNGEKSLAFARAHNQVSEGALTTAPGFQALEDRLNTIYSSKDKIPYGNYEHGKVRNFWSDKDHQRGIWRETTLADYKKETPSWTTLIDVDDLNKKENASYVWHGAECLHPNYTRCLIMLSKGGSDAEIVREFDTVKKDWVKGGFELPEGKHDIGWKDENTVYVGTDFGAGSLTRAGYPRTSREWKRGTKLADAKEIFAAQETDNGGGCSRQFDHNNVVRDLCSRSIDMEKHEVSFLENGKLTKIDKPDDASFSIREDDVFIRIKADWTPTGGSGKTYKNGSLLTMKLKDYRAGKRDLSVMFEPDAHTSLNGWSSTKSFIILNVLRDVKSEVTIYKRANATAPWVGTPMKETVSSVSVRDVDYYENDDVWVTLTDFTVPSTLAIQSLTTGKREQLKKLPSFYDASNAEVTQHFATSKDGTKVPYFQVGPKGKTTPGPTIMTAYGGFGLSQTPTYSSRTGAAWIEKGGTYVLANLRGGNEYGPDWHHAAMLHNRQKAYDDMAAVAEDLAKRNVTTAKQLGVVGGSNGGLLTSVMLTQRPELFGAIVSQAPLANMKRYHKLLAGASWMGEYGDPDKAEDWDALSKYSPFQNIKQGMPYPPIFYTASTKDDRVHPAHAREMVAKLEAYGYQPMYYENIEGGHGGAADFKQAAHVDAMVFTFFTQKLGLK